MDESEKSRDDVKYEVYLSERSSLNEAEKDSSQQFDKAIITLAAGALALSLTFIKQIAPYPKAWTLFFLFSSWLAFGASMLSTLISFLTSQEACRIQRKLLESDFFIKEEQKEKENRPARITKRLNYVSIISFIIGVFLLTVFSISNISTKEKNEMATKKITPEGYVPPEIPKKPADKDRGAGYVPPDIPKKPPVKKK